MIGIDARGIKRPEYNERIHSWIWLDKEFTNWFVGVMSGSVDPYSTPPIRAIQVGKHEEAFTKYIADVGEYLLKISKCRNSEHRTKMFPKSIYGFDLYGLDYLCDASHTI